ncbi:hypothetical protein PIB30_082805 [Stylosanthes scabra]|uniref:Uncharacterized protein n=1 Tax=Stylosanthes scabra TaxID=79078 RepID=A0ABU6YQD1_9FABA|nr:hypothetical protein [Stylosanthes scabra]
MGKARRGLWGCRGAVGVGGGAGRGAGAVLGGYRGIFVSIGCVLGLRQRCRGGRRVCRSGLGFECEVSVLERVVVAEVGFEAWAKHVPDRVPRLGMEYHA